MPRAIVPRLPLVAVFSLITAFAQPAPTPAFIATDVHVSSPNAMRMLAGALPQSDRYELRAATMVDLISRAWGVTPNRIAGGPNWLATDHFDVVASFPAGSNEEAMKSMLQKLLADRFKLVVHNDTKPLPAFAMTVAKGGVKMKKSDASADTGCKSPETSVAAANAGPDYAVQICRKMTMPALAEWLVFQAAGYFQGQSLVDRTNLQGGWDFTLKWSARNQLDRPEAIPLFDGVEKQLGLKIEPAKVPLPVVVVDSVNEKPTDNNPADLKALVGPTEFELAIVKPSAPDSQPQNSNPFLPGGRFELRHTTLKELIEIGWEIQDDSRVVGAPSFTDKDFFDIVAKAPANGATSNLSVASIRVMIQSLLKERFKLAVHNEERPGDAWALIAARPKLTRADPSNRADCRAVASTANPVRNRTIVCTNMTMAQFAAIVPGMVPGYFDGKPAFDATDMEGAYDFTVNFSGSAIYQRLTQSGGGTGGAASSATDPSGAISLQEALQQQLGIRMESQKRPTTVLVVDHVDAQPTDN